MLQITYSNPENEGRSIFERPDLQNVPLPPPQPRPSKASLVDRLDSPKLVKKTGYTPENDRLTHCDI